MCGLHTLRVADEVEAIGCVLHDGIYGFCKALHLLPERLQAGAAVKQVQDSHISARVRLSPDKTHKKQLHMNRKQTLLCNKHMQHVVDLFE